MKRKLMALLMTVMLLVMSAAPALAAKGGTDRPRPGIPGIPPGTNGNTHEQRPDNAVTPVTGPVRDL